MMVYLIEKRVPNQPVTYHTNKGMTEDIRKAKFYGNLGHAKNAIWYHSYLQSHYVSVIEYEIQETGRYYTYTDLVVSKGK